MTSDIIIVGSGAAGLTAALALADRHKVLVVAKGDLAGGSTAWAQGGIAAVLDAGDTFENHIRDTMVAGAGLNRLETVEYVIERAPHAIERLIALGVPFNSVGANLHLTREGGHSHRRIVHVNDATGWAVQSAQRKAAHDQPHITLLPGRTCIDLITGRAGGVGEIVNGTTGILLPQEVSAQELRDRIEEYATGPADLEQRNRIRAFWAAHFHAPVVHARFAQMLCSI